MTASGGDLALSKITAKSNFDLVILDIMMPAVSGLEVCKKIRDKFNLFELPILFCSALADSENIAQGLDLGANDYITKPLNKIELLARVRSLLSLKHMYSVAHANERMAAFRANHDDLTGLPNRSFLQYILQMIIDKAKAENTLVALMLIDINRFRTVNTSFGFVAGDIYLKEISQRILEFVSPEDKVIRMHSNTFSVIKTGIKRDGETKKEINEYASGLIKAINIPIIIQQKKISLNACVGVALFPNDAIKIDNLMHFAESALFQAKNKTKGSILFYEKAHHAAQAAGVEMERKLNDAYENGEFILHYQPQMDVETKVIMGVEALIRWNDPEKGIIPPSKFIPIAEETGLIIPLSKWVLREACIQNKKWQKMGFKPMRVGVNVSAQYLYSENMVGFIKQIIGEVGLEAKYLEIEITESTIMTNDRIGISILKKLKNMGMGISIDDFGTGYSSLNYLKELPVSTLKIDQSFISSDIDINKQIGTIVKTVIKLGHSLGLNVIAEGVETKKQFTYLKENYCNEIQGFLYSKPVEAEEITKMLRSFSSIK